MGLGEDPGCLGGHTIRHRKAQTATFDQRRHSETVVDCFDMKTTNTIAALPGIVLLAKAGGRHADRLRNLGDGRYTVYGERGGGTQVDRRPWRDLTCRSPPVSSTNWVQIREPRTGRADTRVLQHLKRTSDLGATYSGCHCKKYEAWTGFMLNTSKVGPKVHF